MSTFGALKAISGDKYIDGLVYHSQSNANQVQNWSDPALTYSFPTQASFFYKDSAGRDAYYKGMGPNLLGTFKEFNADQKAAVEKAFGIFASVANITFRKVTESNTEHANIRFGFCDRSDTAGDILGTVILGTGNRDAFFPLARQVDVPANQIATMQWNKPGNLTFQNLLHEIGHTVGLDHVKYISEPRGWYDTQDFSIMSGWNFRGLSWYVPDGSYPQSLMLKDIAALQYLYGANFDTNKGNTTYKWNPNDGSLTVTENGRNYLVEAVNNKVRTTIWDGDGNDTHDFSDYRSDLKIQLAPGTWSITSDDQRASKKLGSVTYKAVGSIANAYLFNGDPRSLIENAIGGWGNDIITGNQADNVLTGNAGDDTLDGAVGNDALFGGDGNDKLIGGEGDDTLDGGTGNDVLSGGAGNDVYYVDSASDRVVEGSGPGTDTVYSTVDYSLVDYVENLTLQGQARIGNGNSLNNVIIGNDLGDRLYGGGGNDSLTGGRGADTLDGGDGADRLYGGAGNDMLYGGAGDDNLYGGPGNDTLEGGMGTDVLDGRAGADVFVFRSVNESRANTIVNGVYQDVRDAIVNFDLDQDKIDLSAIDADKTMVRNQQFHFIGAGNFTGQAGELRYDIGTGVVAGDVDGDGIDDFQIYLADRAALTANDFLL